MGGNVAVTVRFSEGQVARAVCWTNVLPGYISNLKLATKDPFHIAELIEPWFSKEDPELFNEVGEHCMYPIEYGLVVVDLQKNVILDMQEYTTLGSIALVSVRASLDVQDDFSARSRLKRAFDERRIKRWSCQPDDDLPLPESFDDIIEMIAKDTIFDDERRWYSSFELDMSPLKIERFPSNPMGSKRLRERVLELGFELSPSEIENWNEYDNYF